MMARQLTVRRIRQHLHTLQGLGLIRHPARQRKIQSHVKGYPTHEVRVGSVYRQRRFRQRGELVLRLGFGDSICPTQVGCAYVPHFDASGHILFGWAVRAIDWSITKHSFKGQAGVQGEQFLKVPVTAQGSGSGQSHTESKKALVLELWNYARGQA